MEVNIKKVAFIYVHNSCRSQIAEAFCKELRDDLLAFSAGTEIKGSINPDALMIILILRILVVRMMRPLLKQ